MEESVTAMESLKSQCQVKVTDVVQMGEKQIDAKNKEI